MEFTLDSVTPFPVTQMNSYGKLDLIWFIKLLIIEVRNDEDEYLLFLSIKLDDKRWTNSMSELLHHLVVPFCIEQMLV